MRDLAVRQRMADGLSLNGARLLELAETPEIVERWETSHRQAIDAGVFDTPTYVLDG